MTRLILLAPLLFAGSAAAQAVDVARSAPAWLGVSYHLRWVQEDGTCSSRVVVDDVIHGAPAERAGLRPGDIIIDVDGEPIPPGRLRAIAERLAPGDSLHLRFQRDGTIRELTAVADRRPDRPLRIFVERTPGSRASAAPIIEAGGETLIARNVGAGWYPGRTRGYWLSRETGETEYRTLGGWSRSRLDERVAELLACADSALSRQAARGEDPTLRRVQQRADSLRNIMTRRAIERQVSDTTRTRGRASPGAGAEQHTVRLSGPDGSFTFQIADHVAVGLRAVAGAEMTALEPELAEYFHNADEGLLVLHIAPGTPADRAGLRPGDVVAAADGRRIESVAELRHIIALPDAGAVDLDIIRRGRSRDLTLQRD